MLVKFNSTTHHFAENILLVNNSGRALTPEEKSPPAARTGGPLGSQPCGPLSVPGPRQGAALSGLALLQQAMWPDEGN